MGRDPLYSRLHSRFEIFIKLLLKDVMLVLLAVHDLVDHDNEIFPKEGKRVGQDGTI